MSLAGFQAFLSNPSKTPDILSLSLARFTAHLPITILTVIIVGVHPMSDVCAQGWGVGSCHLLVY